MKRRTNPRQQRRQEQIEASRNFWCAWGQHHTYKHRELKEQYPGGTICFTCQMAIMENLTAVIWLPVMSEVVYRRARTRYEASRAETLYGNFLREKAPDMEGLVYYIRINGQIKIGFTTNLAQRSRSYPPGSELLAVEPGDKALEKRRHTQFARYLARGREWFADVPPITEHAAELVKEYGLPQKLMHKYTPHRGLKVAADA